MTCWSGFFSEESPGPTWLPDIHCVNQITKWEENILSQWLFCFHDIIFLKTNHWFYIITTLNFAVERMGNKCFYINKIWPVLFNLSHTKRRKALLDQTKFPSNAVPFSPNGQANASGMPTTQALTYTTNTILGACSFCY